MPLSDISADEREAMMREFKNADVKVRKELLQYLNFLRTDGLSAKDRDFLNKLEADFRAVDFSFTMNEK